MNSVLGAIRRWEERQLIDEALAERLRAEVEETSSAAGQRLFQYVLAATGAVVLLIAGGVFLDWAWPLMTDALRAGTLFGIGLLVHLGGVRLEARRRWRPPAYMMQTGGLGLLVSALMYSEEAWPNMTAGGIASGVVALAVPVVLGLPAVKRNHVMPAVHLAGGFLFVGLFLHRATPLVGGDVYWVLDGLLLLAMLRLVRLIAADPDGVQWPWALNAFNIALYTGLVLVFMTGAETLTLGEDTVYPVDVWLFLIAAATVYGIHWAPPGLRRWWFGLQLAACQLAWIPLGFVTTLEVGHGPPEAALVAVSGSGVLGFLYAREHRVREILAVSALSFIAGAWYWGVERAGALGAVVALGVTAGLLFWVSAKGPDGQESGTPA